MNPRTRRAALLAIAAVAILASINALAHSYAGLYQWALHHRMTGWQAVTWPAEIDVFLVVGELALYVAYLDAWTTRHKLWPWTTALVGLAVSVAGNIGHIHANPGTEVLLVDRLTAATSPLAAFAGLAIALLVLKQTRARPEDLHPQPAANLAPFGTRTPRTMLRVAPTLASCRLIPCAISSNATVRLKLVGSPSNATGPEYMERSRVLDDARKLRSEYERRGAHLSRRQLAKHLRTRGYAISNARVPEIASAIGL